MKYLITILLSSLLVYSSQLFARDEQKEWKKEEAALIKKVDKLEKEIKAIKIQNTSNKKMDISSRFNTRETQRSSYTQTSALGSSYNDINKTQKTFKTYSKFKKDAFGKMLILSLENIQIPFTFDSNCKISTISHVHTKSEKSTSLPEISLRSSRGKIFGPWQSNTTDPLGSQDDYYWSITPNAAIPAGTYTIVSSDKKRVPHRSKMTQRATILIFGQCLKIQKDNL